MPVAKNVYKKSFIPIAVSVLNAGINFFYYEVCVCVRACVRAGGRACVCLCVCVCVAYLLDTSGFTTKTASESVLKTSQRKQKRTNR